MHHCLLDFDFEKKSMSENGKKMKREKKTKNTFLFSNISKYTHFYLHNICLRKFREILSEY